MNVQLATFTLALVLLAAPLTSEAQQTERVYRIGWLSVGSPSGAVDARRAFSEALLQLGYKEGRTLLVEDRFAEGRSDRLRDFAAELVRLKVDVLVSHGTPAGLAAKQATTSIPIVAVGSGDPVGSGLVSSLGRPGGNVTGVSAAYRDIVAKCVELLKDVVPGMSRIGFLGNADNVVNKAHFTHAQAAAGTLGLAMEYFSATKPDEVGRALAAMSRARVQGVIVTADVVITSRQGEIVEFVARVRLPAVYFVDDYVDMGGLMSYGPNRRELFRHAAVYVDKILKGAKPADLPVEQPMKVALAVNLKTARALGLTIPPSVLLRADHVVE
ncbi:MAG: ABC transporter substrate-binding protein [Candidatus Rokubacteria bacterium]|nr:ABC transporter substrate-binding protein [Candidatus Rokubacteria bacterium]